MKKSTAKIKTAKLNFSLVSEHCATTLTKNGNNSLEGKGCVCITLTKINLS